MQLFKDSALIDRASLSFAFSSTYPGYPDGVLNNLCNSDGGSVDTNPTLTIISATAFDAVTVYNRADGAGTDRINGANITAIVGGVSSSAQFPTAAAAQYSLSLSSGSLLLLSPCKYLQPGLITCD